MCHYLWRSFNYKSDYNFRDSYIRDFTSWDVSNVTAMRYFINNQYVNISGWDTSKVTDMEYAFIGCGFYNPENIYLETKNVTNMKGMFSEAFVFPNITRFDTRNVTDMSYMFYKADFRDYEQISSTMYLSWDTSKVTNMSHMFDSAETKDVSILLKNWDTSNVTDMSYMFRDISFQEKQNFKDWDTSKVTNMSHMFCGTSFQEKPDIENWDTSKVTDMSWMFWDCNLEISPDFINDWDMSNVENTAFMLSRCTMTGSFIFTTPVTNVKNAEYMFHLLKLVKTTEDEETYLEIKNWDTSKTTNMSGMFGSIEADHLYIEGLSFESCTNAQYLFSVASAKTITIRDWYSIGDTPIDNIFYGCFNLTDLYIINVVAEDFKKIVEAIPVEGWGPDVITVHCQSSVYYQVFDDNTNIYQVTFVFDIP